MEHVLPSPKVSILVPIYNVEKYLEQCLSSLVNQTLLDIEIICIDDGSTDSSPHIIERYAAKDSRVKVITKPNSGYGASMNQGLSKAEGEFIGIVESDDYVELDMFERLYAKALEVKTPVVRCDYYFTWGEPNARDEEKRFYLDKNYDRLLSPVLDHQVYRVPPAIWSGIYERSLLEQYSIGFLESPGASFQDTGFNYKVLSAAQSLYVMNVPFLHYRQDNAASSVKATTKIYCVVDELKSSLDFLEQFPERRETLRKVLQGVAYQTYRWNILRIAHEHRKEFCDFMYIWFKEASDANELEPQYFSNGMYDEVQILIKDPEGYFKRIYSPLNKYLSRRERDIHFTLASFGTAFKRHLARRFGKRSS